MDHMNTIRRGLLLILSAGLLFFLSSCRTRTGSIDPDSPVSAGGGTRAGEADANPGSIAVTGTASEPGETDVQENEGSGSRTRENPDAPRKEYDENAPAEIVPGTERLLHTEGGGSGASVPSEDAEKAVSRLNEQAEEPAVQTVAAPEAEEKGVSEDAEAADSALTYYTVLLKDRGGSLYECQRAYLYWETAEDHVTVHKSSPEHTLILGAGAYDVSARLLPENLRVTDSWVVRKNPQIIVKVADSGILGSGVSSAGSAKALCRELCLREGWPGIEAVKSRRVLLLSRELLDAPYLQTAAMLMIAKTAYPDLYADVDLSQALRLLSEEAAGTARPGIYYYAEEGT